MKFHNTNSYSFFYIVLHSLALEVSHQSYLCLMNELGKAVEYKKKFGNFQFSETSRNTKKSLFAPPPHPENYWKIPVICHILIFNTNLFYFLSPTNDSVKLDKNCPLYSILVLSFIGDIRD